MNRSRTTWMALTASLLFSLAVGCGPQEPEQPPMPPPPESAG